MRKANPMRKWGREEKPLSGDDESHVFDGEKGLSDIVKPAQNLLRLLFEDLLERSEIQP